MITGVERGLVEYGVARRGSDPGTSHRPGLVDERRDPNDSLPTRPARGARIHRADAPDRLRSVNVRPIARACRGTRARGLGGRRSGRSIHGVLSRRLGRWRQLPGRSRGLLRDAVRQPPTVPLETALAAGSAGLAEPPGMAPAVHHLYQPPAHPVLEHSLHDTGGQMEPGGECGYRGWSAPPELVPDGEQAHLHGCPPDGRAACASVWALPATEASPCAPMRLMTYTVARKTTAIPPIHAAVAAGWSARCAS